MREMMGLAMGDHFKKMVDDVINDSLAIMAEPLPHQPNPAQPLTHQPIPAPPSSHQPNPAQPLTHQPNPEKLNYEQPNHEPDPEKCIFEQANPSQNNLGRSINTIGF